MRRRERRSRRAVLTLNEAAGKVGGAEIPRFPGFQVGLAVKKYPSDFLGTLARLLLTGLLSAVPLTAQRGGATGDITQSATVVVSVRTGNGALLTGSAFVRLYSHLRGVDLTQSIRGNAQAIFSNIVAGDYDIEVTAPGYRGAHVQTTVAGTSQTTPVYIYLQPEGAPGEPATPAMPPPMNPKAQKELTKALEALKAQRLEEAWSHLEKAEPLAPESSDVHYLLGVLLVAKNNSKGARQEFEKAVSHQPRHERALIALGELQLRAGDATAAAQTLEQALAVNSSAWRTHSLLANAYLQVQEPEKARAQAVRALELGKDQAAAANLILGRALMLLARQAIASYLKAPPDASGAAQAKDWLAELDAPPEAAFGADTQAAMPAETLSIPIPLPDPLPAPVAVAAGSWAPPDIDAAVPGVADGVACPLDAVLTSAGKRIQQLLGDFERFTATERLEHQEIDRAGNPGPAREHQFEYLAVLARPRPGLLFVEESRNGINSLENSPTPLASSGLAALAVYLLHPLFANEFHYSCEGLGQWRGQPAWQIRFEERPNLPDPVHTWRVKGDRYPVRTKGRIWIGANTYQVMHVETDLAEPLPVILLARDHMAIDYGPVKFEKSKAELWLPWRAEQFLEFRGRRYHHRHTFGNYLLFSVDTTTTIHNPKDSEP